MLQEGQESSDLSSEEGMHSHAEGFFDISSLFESTQLCVGDSCYEFTMQFMISLVIAFMTIFLSFYYLWCKFFRDQKVLPQITSMGRPRFRKRDKVMFYGRKMIRRVANIAKPSNSKSKTMGKRRKLEVLKIAKQLLRLKKDKQPTRHLAEPPSSFFEPDAVDVDYEDHKLPAEVLYMLKGVRVLGHFEKPIFLELCRYMESHHLRAGEQMFRVGEPDDSIYVVQSGKLSVYVVDSDGTSHVMKVVQKGDSVHSLLSVMDILTGHPAPFKTVNAKAVVDTIILKLPVHAFQLVLDRFPESQVRVVQIIMVRLQRVTFMALYNYLGLTSELMTTVPQEDEHKLTVQGLNIPVREGQGRRPKSDGTPDHLLEDDDKTGPGGSPKKKKLTFSEDTKSIPITSSVSVGKSQLSDVEPNDFDVACLRARVGLSIDAEDPILSGSPPVKQFEDNMPHSYGGYSSSRRHKKISLMVSAEGGLEHLPKDDLDDEEILKIAVADIANLFNLPDKDLLSGKCFLQHFRAGATITRQGDQNASLYFLVAGELVVSQTVVGQKNEAVLFSVLRGELVGALAVLTGEPSFFRIRARKDSVVIVISKQDFYSLMREHPKVVLSVGHTIVRRMSPLVRQIDFALDWQMVEAGHNLFKQGDSSDCVYILLNGRLRSFVTLSSGKKELVAEYGRGELIGIVEVLTQTERATSMIAIRDSELAVIPDHLLNVIKRRYPQVVTRLIHLLGQRILGSLGNRPASNKPQLIGEREPRPATANLSTVAIVAISDDVPLTNFTLDLQHSLNAIGSSLRLTSDIIQNRLGSAALEPVNEYRLSSWLGQQEDMHRMVLYQADHRMTPWTQRCIRQADCILIVGLALNDPTVSKLEQHMERFGVRAQKELILLHPEDGYKPRHTVEWLNQHGYCSSHHHIRCPKRVFSRKSRVKTEEVYRQLFATPPDRMSDFSRLARFLTGTSVGLVLGGGGARGIAHIGIIRSMLEAGIPIDMVGGTSIGSFMGALWAEERNLVRITQRAREWSMEFSKTWKKVLDLTYPVTAMFSGRAFNRSIQDVFHERQIEDLWIPYFCITTDISSSKMRVHTIGSVWRYVRASMSLSGYLPPLCDPSDGHLLLDGGYVNNLPADIMRSMGAQTIFAVDVGAEDTTNYDNFGDELSGWWLYFNKWNPWGKAVKIPNMQDIQSKLAYVSCVKLLEEIKSQSDVEYIRPPIARFSTLQFHSFDDILEVGYSHGQTLFNTWVKSGLVKQVFKEHGKRKEKPTKTNIPAEAYFTDLAELISRIDDPPFSGVLFEEEDIDDDEMSTVSDPGLAGEEVDGSVIMRPRLQRAVSEGGSPVVSTSSTPTEEYQMPLNLSDVTSSDSNLTSQTELSNQSSGASSQASKGSSQASKGSSQASSRFSKTSSHSAVSQTSIMTQDLL